MGTPLWWPCWVRVAGEWRVQTYRTALYSNAVHVRCDVGRLVARSWQQLSLDLGQRLT
jgi:hypothetical protein